MSEANEVMILVALSTLLIDQFELGTESREERRQKAFTLAHLIEAALNAQAAALEFKAAQAATTTVQ